MNIQKNVSLAPYTSLNLGGRAENFVEVHNTDELLEVLRSTDTTPVWLLGYGSNALISDKGLDGLVICMRGGTVQVDGNHIIADAGAWWDDIVQTAAEHNLWGIELMSEVPGSVGAAVFINITAYGQSVGPRVKWVDVWNQDTHHIQRLERSDFEWDYKKSIFQRPENQNLIILRTCLALSTERTDELVYQKALDVAQELGLDQDSLQNRREIIIEARKRAGSIWKPAALDSPTILTDSETPDERGDSVSSLAESTNSPRSENKATTSPLEHSESREVMDKSSVGGSHTAGSFFRNPVVPEKVADHVMNFDETGKTPAEIKKMNQVHGGNEKRVSAAHVMLAAGFTRGQTWGNVKLNDQNLLKIEALPGATAQEFYDVAMSISMACQEKLGIQLEPEAQILGNFD